MYPEAVKKLSEKELNEHPKYLVLMALNAASEAEAEFFLQCLIKVAKEGFLEAPVNEYVRGNPHGVFFKGETLSAHDMRCLIPRKNSNYISVRAFTSRYTDESGTWLGFSPEFAEGLKELLGEKFAPVSIFGDEK